MRKLLKATLILLDCFKQILDWEETGIAILPGAISLLAGLLMWVTSLSPVRKQYFELFFYTHQLYVVFVVFLAMHVGDFVFSMAAGGIFLFMLDRFLRFCQSRRTVDIISATCLPCGTVELVLSKPGSNKTYLHTLIIPFCLLSLWYICIPSFRFGECRSAVQCPQFYFPSS